MTKNSDGASNASGQQLKMDYNDDDCEVMMADIPETKPSSNISTIKEDTEEVKFEVMDAIPTTSGPSTADANQQFEVVEV